MNTITYKGYVGSIQFSAEDEVFFGKIEHINDLITFESDNAHKLREAFEETVNDYIKFCNEKGTKPEKPFKGSFNVRVSPSVHKLAFIKAKETGISLNKLIERAIEKEVQ